MCTFNEATQNIADSLRENAPIIGIIFGVGTLIASGVVASIAARKVDPILDEHKEELERIKKAKEEGTIDEKSASKQVGKAYVKTAGKVALKFAPAIGMALAGSVLVFNGWHIEHERYLNEHDKFMTVSAALTATYADFAAYRERARARFGPEVDNELMYGMEKEEVEETFVDEKGKTKTKKKEVTKAENAGDLGYGVYAKWFKEGSSDAWVNDPDMNQTFVKACEKAANEKLLIEGKLVVNDIYDILGLVDENGQPIRTKAGQVMGWINDPSKVYQIEFGIFEPVNNDFVRGDSPNCLICPIPEGNIWELMED